MNKQTILVTGASGFLGAHLISILENNYSHIITVLRNSDAFNETTAIKADLSCQGWTDNLPVQADIVIHLAQSVQYNNFPKGSKDMIAVNIDACAELMEWARKSAVKHVMIASTGSIYSGSTGLLTEESPLDISSMYIATKNAAEGIARQYQNYFRVSILRFFTLYGSGQKKGVIHTIIDRIMNHEKVILAGNIGMSTTPLYVDDAVRMIVKLCEIEDAGCSVYNFGGNETIDLRYVVDIIGKYLDVKPVIVVTDDAPIMLMGDSSKLYTQLGILPEMSFEQGVRNMLSV